MDEEDFDVEPEMTDTMEADDSNQEMEEGVEADTEDMMGKSFWFWL